MGLDSVELVMEWEKYFGIDIPDNQAAQINTVEDATNTVSKLLLITENNNILRDSILHKLNNCLLELKILDRPLKLDDNVFRILDPKEPIWKSLSEKLNLKIPLAYCGPSNSVAGKLLSFVTKKAVYDWKYIKTEQLIWVIGANNIEKLIDRKNLRSRYEVYLPIIAITVERCGVDFYEVFPEKSFTNDFGID
jgi:acyl carrier protein